MSISNINQLELKSFRLEIERIPTVQYFCIAAPLPGVSSTSAIQYSPFTNVKVPGDKMTFNPLIVDFIVDEDLQNWLELFNWMTSYAHPGSFEQYQDIDQPSKGQLVRSKTSQGTLIVPNNKYNNNKEFIFENLHPIDISEVMFNVQIDDTQVALCTATFEYTQYYPRVNS